MVVNLSTQRKRKRKCKTFSSSSSSSFPLGISFRSNYLFAADSISRDSKNANGDGGLKLAVTLLLSSRIFGVICDCSGYFVDRATIKSFFLDSVSTDTCCVHHHQFPLFCDVIFQRNIGQSIVTSTTTATAATTTIAARSFIIIVYILSSKTGNE